MIHSDYVSRLESKLQDIDKSIERAQKLLEGPELSDKYRALGELAHLRGRRDALLNRIEEAKAKGADQWSELHASLQEEADALTDTLERWLTRF